MMEKKYDLVILGSGPGGYVSAIRAAQLGLSVCLIEKEKLGGVCLNWGCIPAKSLLKSVHLYKEMKIALELGIIATNIGFDFSLIQKRKEKVVKQLCQGVEFLLNKHKVDIVYGKGKLLDYRTVIVDDHRMIFDNCIIAVGSKPIELESVKFNLSCGIISSKEALALDSIPKSIAIIGAGVIGCEFADIFAGLGAEVKLIEIAGQILPNEDAEIANCLAVELNKKGIKILTSAQVSLVRNLSSGLNEISLNSGVKIEAEKILLAVGRKPDFEGSGVLEVGIVIKEGKILVDERMRTNVENIYAVGDVVGKTYLAHVATREGIIAVENITKKKSIMDYDVIPRCVYTHPQIASVGLSEAAARQKYKDIKVGKFILRASGKALVENIPQGIVKLVVNSADSKVVGASICANEAAELIHVICVGMQQAITYERLAETIFAHPTISETIKEAAEAIDKKAIHAV
ncbi:MAG: dihydrolipoyl dehydrogenase [Candidatus Omnitrophica bacterium]|nr:dihydrolipoyl dehydrogenase [Candidatus Omnitrophota bacterium]